MFTFVFLLIFSSVFLTGYVVIPSIIARGASMSEKRQTSLTSNMEQFISKKEAKKMSKLLFLAPLVMGGGFYILSPPEMRIVGTIVGVVCGMLLPGFYIKIMAKRTKDKFSTQLIDALMIMSSSFRGGLSLIQAIEAVVEEMPDPVNKEFGTVLGENKMGVSLEEALSHLYNRMPSSALQQMITAILLARETGGNLPAIFTRIATTIRENKKIQQNIDTLTIQGRIQGIVMSLLPIAFAFVIYTTNRRVFNHMLESETGRGMLIYAVVSEIFGAFMIIKISTFKDF